MRLLCNLLFYSLSLLFTAVLVVVMCPYFIIRFTFAPGLKSRNCLRWMVRYYGWVIIYILPRFFIKVKFQKMAVEASGPAVYVSNHRSSSDAFLMALVDKVMVQVVNDWPFKLPLLGWVARKSGYLRVKGVEFDQFLAEGTSLIEQGVSVVGFPEGTRSGDQRLGAFKGGMFRLALHTKVQIIPICIVGNEDKPRRGSLMLNKGKVEAYQLKPIAYEEYKHMTAFALKKHVEKLMAAFIDNL